MHEKALISVALTNKRPVECFICGRKTRPLELDHIRYYAGSVKGGHEAERAEEAMRYPERFRIVCRGCHIGVDLKAAPMAGSDPGVGSQVRAREAARNRLHRRDAQAEVIRKEEVIRRLLRERDDALKLVEEYKATLEALR